MSESEAKMQRTEKLEMERVAFPFKSKAVKERESRAGTGEEGRAWTVMGGRNERAEQEWGKKGKRGQSQEGSQREVFPSQTVKHT